MLARDIRQTYAAASIEHINICALADSLLAFVACIINRQLASGWRGLDIIRNSLHGEAAEILASPGIK